MDECFEIVELFIPRTKDKINYIKVDFDYLFESDTRARSIYWHKDYFYTLKEIIKLLSFYNKTDQKLFLKGKWILETINNKERSG